jgi:hypothetical protein
VPALPEAGRHERRGLESRQSALGQSAIGAGQSPIWPANEAGVRSSIRLPLGAHRSPHPGHTKQCPKVHPKAQYRSASAEPETDECEAQRSHGQQPLQRVGSDRSSQLQLPARRLSSPSLPLEPPTHSHGTARLPSLQSLAGCRAALGGLPTSMGVTLGTTLPHPQALRSLRAALWWGLLATRAMSVPFARGSGGRQRARTVNVKRADLANLASALVRLLLGVALGAGGRGFKSRRPDRSQCG